MSYLVLARKYRPQRFADMVGQEHVTRTLSNAIRCDRVHHAYLFCGVRGLGKTTAARILAKCLVCEKGPSPEPCDGCEQCRAVSQGRSVDVIEIDGASNNSVDDIRSLREQVYYLPQSARRKIYIIDEVHMLTQQAFNALLKTLEEPPEHVTFLFATTDPHKVLPTILSRVSRLDYRRVSAAVLVPFLRKILQKEEVVVEDEGLHVIARCGEGSVRDSLTLLDKVIAFAQDPGAIKTAEVLAVLGEANRFSIALLAQAVLDRDAGQTLGLYRKITDSGCDVMRFCVAFLQHLRDLCVIKTCDSRELLLDMSDDLFEQMRAQAAGSNATVLAQYFDRFSRVIDNLDRSRVPSLVVEMGLLDLVSTEPLVPIGALIAQLRSPTRGSSGSDGPPPSAGTRSQPGQKRGEHGRGVRSALDSSVTAQSRTAQKVSGEPNRDAQSTRPEPTPADTAAPSDTSSPRHLPPQPAHDTERSVTEAVEPHIPPVRTGGGQSGIADQLWNMFHESQKSAVQPSSPPPPSSSQKSSVPTEGAFQLSGKVEAPSEPVVIQAIESVGDCAGSRCGPQQIIPWKNLAPFVAWETLLQKIGEAREDLLFAVLADMGLSALGPDTIVLAVPSGSFAADQIRTEPELQARFAHFTTTYFGEAMPLRLIDAPPCLPDLPSLDLVEKQRAQRHAAAMTREAQTDPNIKRLLATFSGELGNVKVLAAESTGSAQEPSETPASSA